MQKSMTYPSAPLPGPDALGETMAMLASLASCRSGSARPADVVDQELWLDTSADPIWTYKVWNSGEGLDHTLLTINTSTGTLSLPPILGQALQAADADSDVVVDMRAETSARTARLRWQRSTGKLVAETFDPVSGSQLSSVPLALASQAEAQTGTGAGLMSAELTTQAMQALLGPPRRIISYGDGATHTVSADARYVEVHMWGAGGAGFGLGTLTTSQWGGAGAGAYGRVRIPAVAGDTLAIIVGAPGDSNPGGNTSVTSGHFGSLGTAGGGGAAMTPRGTGGYFTNGAVLPVFHATGGDGAVPGAGISSPDGDAYWLGGAAYGWGAMLGIWGISTQGTGFCPGAGGCTCGGPNMFNEQFPRYNRGGWGYVLVVEY